MTSRRWAWFAACLLLPLSAVSAYAVCEPVTAAGQAAGESMTLWQYTFPDGTHDLVMAKSPDAPVAEIKRVTFGGSKQDGCQYQPLALVRGGDWGWHIVWTQGENHVLHYARMDGEAWVSSPPKRLASRDVTAARLHINGQQLVLDWQQAAEADKRYRAVSEDEGRFWEPVEQVPAH